MKISVEKNELDEHFLFSIAVGCLETAFAATCFIVSIFWDVAAKNFAIQHQSGLGIGQICMILASGALTFIGVTYLQNVLLYMKYYGR